MSDIHVNPPVTEAVTDLVVAMLGVRRTFIRRAGITESELRAMEHVSTAPSSPGELARHLEMSTAASTGVVDRLERHGYVERRAHPTDRRRQEVHLTAGGRAEMDRHLGPMLSALAGLEAALSDDERETVMRYLAGAVDAFGLIIDEDT